MLFILVYFGSEYDGILYYIVWLTGDICSAELLFGWVYEKGKGNNNQCVKVGGYYDCKGQLCGNTCYCYGPWSNPFYWWSLTYIINATFIRKLKRFAGNNIVIIHSILILNLVIIMYDVYLYILWDNITFNRRKKICFFPKN